MTEDQVEYFTEMLREHVTFVMIHVPAIIQLALEETLSGVLMDETKEWLCDRLYDE